MRVTSAIFVFSSSIVVNRPGLGMQKDGRLTGHVDVRMGANGRGAAAAVSRRLAAPLHDPAAVSGRGQQRLGYRAEIDVASEIDDQQPIPFGATLVSQHQHLRRDDGAVRACEAGGL